MIKLLITYVIGASPVGAATNYIFILNSTPDFNGLGKDKVLQVETRKIQVSGFGATNIRDLTVLLVDWNNKLPGVSPSSDHLVPLLLTWIIFNHSMD